MKSRRRGLGRSSPVKGSSFFSDPGRRRMAKSGSSPRNSPSGGSSSSQGRLRISGASEAIVRNRVLPEGTAEQIFSQEEARKRAKSWAPRAASAPASISGRQDYSNREPKLREICRTVSESGRERLWLVRMGWPSREMWKRYVELGGAPDSFMDKVIVGCGSVVLPPG